MRTYYLFVIIGLLFIPMVYADSNGVWIDAKDVRSGTFGSDEGNGDFSFPGSLYVSDNLTVSQDIRGNQIFMNGDLVATQNWVINQNYQKRVSDTCPNGQSIRVINSDGSVVCHEDTLEVVLNNGNNAGGKRIMNLKDPIGFQDAATKKFVLDEKQTLSEVLNEGNNGGGQRINNIASANSNDDAANWGQIKSWVNSNDDVGDPSSTNELQNIEEVLNRGNNAGGQRINNIASANSNDDAARWGQIKNWVNNNDDVNDADSDPNNEIQNLNEVLDEGNWAGDRIRGVNDPQDGRDSANKRYIDGEIDKRNDLIAEKTESYWYGGTSDYVVIDPGANYDGIRINDAVRINGNLEINDNMNMKDNRIWNLDDPVFSYDAATRNYVDNCIELRMRYRDSGKTSDWIKLGGGSTNTGNGMWGSKSDKYPSGVNLETRTVC